MNRSTRMFEIIQLLRSASRSMTAQELANKLEVTRRTVYRDIVALQAMRVPIDGEAGIGYKTFVISGWIVSTRVLRQENISTIAARIFVTTGRRNTI